MRGIEIKTAKERTRYEKIGNLPLPEKVILYTSQHIGSPAEVLVKKGEKVKRGQMIARAASGCSAALHASVGGVVKDVALMDKPGGRISNAVVIEAGEEQQPVRMKKLRSKTPEKIRERVSEAGIIGMGGAGFPSSLKLNPPGKIHTAILNGCECEPYLTADERLMIEEPRKVVEGFILMMETVGAERGFIGIEDDKPEAISMMKGQKGRNRGIDIKVLPKVYPQGYEKMLITALTGREVPSGGLPHDVGVSVHNVSTALAVYEAVNEGKPLTERVLTVTGNCIVNPANVKAAVGMPVEELMSYYNVESRGGVDLYMGGPMMGFSLDNFQTGILKTTSGIVMDRLKKEREYPCVNCGRCVDWCPMSLVPQRLNRLYEAADTEALCENGISDCMECGICAYVCPSKIPLTHKFKTGKTLI